MLVKVGGGFKVKIGKKTPKKGLVIKLTYHLI